MRIKGVGSEDNRYSNDILYDLTDVYPTTPEPVFPELRFANGKTLTG
jgi:hypothetical protein